MNQIAQIGELPVGQPCHGKKETYIKVNVSNRIKDAINHDPTLHSFVLRISDMTVVAYENHVSVLPMDGTRFELNLQKELSQTPPPVQLTTNHKVPVNVNGKLQWVDLHSTNPKKKAPACSPVTKTPTVQQPPVKAPSSENPASSPVSKAPSNGVVRYVVANYCTPTSIHFTSRKDGNGKTCFLTVDANDNYRTAYFTTRKEAREWLTSDSNVWKVLVATSPLAPSCIAPKGILQWIKKNP